jgi:hypothetical protein
MFMADGRTCEEFFFVFENAIQASDVPDHMILRLLSSYVTGTALQSLKLHMNDTIHADWRSFKTILRSTFQPKDDIFRTRQKLVTLKQGSDSIDTYNKKYLRLSTQLAMNFDDLLYHYTNGLSVRLIYEKMSKTPSSTMDEALAIATQYEYLHARYPVDVNTMLFEHNRHHQGPSTGSRRFIPSVTPRIDKPSCSYCHKRGHNLITLTLAKTLLNAKILNLLFPILIHGPPLRIKSQSKLNHAVHLVLRFVKDHADTLPRIHEYP